MNPIGISRKTHLILTASGDALFASDVNPPAPPPTSLDIIEWAASLEWCNLSWDNGLSGDRRLRGWVGSDGLRAIETNGNTVWSEDASLDLPFDAYWDAESLDAERLIGDEGAS